jgi:hypothetical protein
VDIPLGLGSSLGNGTIQSVTIAKDPTSPYDTVNDAWIIYLQCFTDPAYTVPCTDWVMGNPSYVQQGFEVGEPATTTTDGTHWTAYFTNPQHEHNADGTSPLTFNPNEYYQLEIYDNGWEIGGYGSQALSQIYWVMTGIK